MGARSAHNTRASSHRVAVVVQLVERPAGDREVPSSYPGLEQIFSSFCTMKSGTFFRRVRAARPEPSSIK